MTDRADRSHAGDLATEPLQSEKSLGELFGDLADEVGRLVRQELDLAKTEARDEAKKAGRSAAMFGVAGVGGLMTALFLSFALAWLLDQALNTALSFAIVGVLWAIVAAVLMARARQQVADIRPLPQTMTTLKEDAQWASRQRN